jgi:hypothetical protein
MHSKHPLKLFIKSMFCVHMYIINCTWILSANQHTVCAVSRLQKYAAQYLNPPSGPTFLYVLLKLYKKVFAYTAL